MPRSRRSRRVIDDEAEADNSDDDDQVLVDSDLDNDDDDEKEEQVLMDSDDDEEEGPSSRRRKRNRDAAVKEDDDENVQEEEEDLTQHSLPNTQGTAMTASTVLPQMCSQLPDNTQDIMPAREAERNKFLQMGDDRREKAVTDVLRLVLFKGVSGDSIDRLKIAKEAQINDARVSGAVFEEVQTRLDHLFGFELRRVPRYLEKRKDFPPKCKDRYYLVNAVDESSGQHVKEMYKSHEANSLDKGLLMVVLGLIWCKGNPLGDGSRWILDKDLYRLLHAIDENISAQPPAPGVTTSHKNHHTAPGVPDVDHSMDRFVKMDYLYRTKATDQLLALNDQAEDASVFYALGPRAAVEIGERQILNFCSQILGEEITDEMQAEIADAEEE